MKYTKITSEVSGVEFVVRENEDGTTTFIPMDEANADYQAYLNPDKVEHLTEIIPSEAKTK